MTLEIGKRYRLCASNPFTVLSFTPKGNAVVEWQDGSESIVHEQSFKNCSQVKKKMYSLAWRWNSTGDTRTIFNSRWFPSKNDDPLEFLRKDSRYLIIKELEMEIDE